MIIIYKNNIVIKILVTDLLNTLLLLLLISLMINFLLKNWWCSFTIFAPVRCAVSWKRLKNSALDQSAQWHNVIRYNSVQRIGRKNRFLRGCVTLKSLSRCPMSRKRGSLAVSQPYGLPRPVTRIALPYFMNPPYHHWTLNSLHNNRFVKYLATLNVKDDNSFWG
jgi:hypothetical protein